MDFHELLESKVELHSDEGIDNLQNGLMIEACDDFNKAYDLSLQLKDNYAKRACAFNLGATYIAVGKFSDGLQVLSSAFPSESDKDENSSGDLFFNFGLGYEGIGEKDRALDFYSKAADEYKEEENNEEMEKEVQKRISSVTTSATGMSCGSVTVNQEQKWKDEVTLHAKSLMRKAKRHYRNSEIELSEKFADKSLSYLQQTGAVPNNGTLFNDLGLLYMKLQLFRSAEVCFKMALALVGEGSGDRDVHQAMVQQNLGAVYNFMGDYQKAVEIHRKAAAQYVKLSDKSKESHCYANLAFAYSQLKDWNSAKEAFQTALQGTFQTDDKHTAWQLLEGLGAVYFAEGDSENAVSHFQEALNILKESEHNVLVLNRIKGKLQHAIKQHEQQMPVRRSVKIKRQPGENRLPQDQGSVHEPPTREKIATPRKPRYVPVAKSGSLRRFDKVAQGLAVQSSLQSTRHRLMVVTSGSDTSTD